jgi:hypothetical protein
LLIQRTAQINYLRKKIKEEIRGESVESFSTVLEIGVGIK